MQTRFTPPTTGHDGLFMSNCYHEPRPGAPWVSPEVLCILKAACIRAEVEKTLDMRHREEYTCGGNIPNE